MKLRLIHSCMVLGVLFLLFCYSAFLTSPQFNEDNGLREESRKGDIVVIPLESVSHDASNVALLSQEVTKELNSQSQTSRVHSGESSSRKDTEQKRDVHGVGESGTAELPPSQPQVPPTESKTTPPKSTTGTPPITMRDIYESGFLYPNPSLCPNDGEGIRLLIMIMSAPSHISARDAIRLTWAHYAQRIDISIVFVIGRTSNETVLEEMEREKHIYDDLIIANFADSYDNLTLKTMATLEWIETFCNQSQFVLKTDDDMFINVPNLLNFILKIEDDDAKVGKIYGRLAKKWKPVRNKKSKYYISFQQFRKTVYPDFTTGPAYLFSTRLASKLFAKGMENTYLKLEDVFTTGLVAQQLGIKRMNIGDFANKKVNFRKTGYCALSRLISMHMVAYHEQFELWKKLLDGRTKCKIIYQTKQKKSVKEVGGPTGGGAIVKISPTSS